MSAEPRSVFVTGGTGFLGLPLIQALVERGHRVQALARAASVARLPRGCAAVVGDALDPQSFRDALVGADTLVHLVGVAKPSPWKRAQFRDIDLASVRVALEACRGGSVRHFVYLSVAQPAPVMKAFVWARREAEILIRSEGYAATFARPWYVLGPGRRWPLCLVPFYALFERLPATRETARRIGLVSLAQMTSALMWAVEHPAAGVRVLDVQRLREIGGGYAEGPWLAAPAAPGALP